MANLKVWDGTQWVPAGVGPATANVQIGPPTTPMTGQLWFDTDDVGAAANGYLDGAQIAVYPGNYNVGSTTFGNVGNTIAFTSPGAWAVYLVHASIVGSGPAAVVNFVTLGIDGAAYDDTNRMYSPSNNTYFTIARTWRVTGLAAGAHTFGIRSANNGAGTFVHAGSDSLLNYQRIV